MKILEWAIGLSAVAAALAIILILCLYAFIIGDKWDDDEGKGE